MIEQELRKAIYQLHLHGMRKRELARRLEIDRKTIKRIIKSKKPESLILEIGKAHGSCDQSTMNQKTYWIAQNLASDGWKIDNIKNALM